jgi:hypothetical protein
VRSIKALFALPRDKQRSIFLLLVVTAFVVVGMLYFGVRLKGYRPGNNVHWSDSGAGLIFGRDAQAFTEGFFPVLRGRSGAGLTIELAIRPAFPNYANFRFLVLVHDGDDDRQLVIGQWRSSLVIMNGDDYSNKLRSPKIYLKLDEQAAKAHLVSIVSNAAGTRIFIDGVLKKRSNKLVLRYPEKVASARLVVGNSMSGQHGWVGTVMGLAFYDRDLTDGDLLQHFRQWRMTRDFGRFIPEGPHLVYAFDEGQGERAFNKLGDGLDLMIPPWRKVLQRNVLSWPRVETLDHVILGKDILVNLLGFVPLGILLMALLARFEGGAGGRTGKLVAVLVAFLFSLGIEIVQVWIPSRDSSLLDLLLNTMGGFLGVVFYCWVVRRF